jgi:hypothetical protein
LFEYCNSWYYFFHCNPGKSTLKEKISQRINHLLSIADTEKKFNNVLRVYVIKNQNLSIFKIELLLFINEFQSLRPHVIEIYGDLYTLLDINGVIKFYSSALGKK